MRQTFIFLLFIYYALPATAQQGHFTLRGHRFAFSETDTLLDGAQQRTLLLQEENRNHACLAFPLDNIQSDCNSESVMIGEVTTPPTAPLSSIISGPRPETPPPPLTAQGNKPTP